MEKLIRSYRTILENTETTLDVNRNTVSDLMIYLEKAGIINQLRDDTKGIKLLGKVDKVYLNNPNLAYAISDNEPNIGNIRETIFFALMSTTHNVTQFLFGHLDLYIKHKNCVAQGRFSIPSYTYYYLC